jgi:hypothetical protein
MYRPAALSSAVRLSPVMRAVYSRQAWATALVLAFPLLSLVTGFGIGLAGFLFLITACLWWRACAKALRLHWPHTRWVLLALSLHLAWLAWLTLAGGPGRSANALDAPARMCIAGAAMLVVQVARPALRALWLGAAGGALLGAAFVAWQRLGLGMARPGGLLNPITFGDLSLCLALLALAGAIDAGAGPRTGTQAGKGARAVRWIAMAGIVAGLAASLLTGSRGGWLALPAAFILLARLPVSVAWCWACRCWPARWRWAPIGCPRPACGTASRSASATCACTWPAARPRPRSACASICGRPACAWPPSIPGPASTPRPISAACMPGS